MRTILFICIAALFTSCATTVNVAKRKHRGGWYVSVSNNTQNIIAKKKENPLKKNVTATKQSIVPDNLATEIQLIDSVVVKRRSLKIDSSFGRELLLNSKDCGSDSLQERSEINGFAIHTSDSTDDPDQSGYSAMDKARMIFLMVLVGIALLAAVVYGILSPLEYGVKIILIGAGLPLAGIIPGMVIMEILNLPTKKRVKTKTQEKIKRMFKGITIGSR